MKEIATEYQEIEKKERSNYYKKEGELGFVVDMDWFRRWERMVYLRDFQFHRQPVFNEMNVLEVGPVTNDRILYNTEDIWTDSDETSVYNKIIKPQFKFRSHFKVVSEDMWNFFKRNGGTEIKRFYRKGWGYGAEIEATYQEVPLSILPTFDEYKTNKEDVAPTKLKSIFISKHEKLSDLKE